MHNIYNFNNWILISRKNKKNKKKILIRCNWNVYLKLWERGNFLECNIQSIQKLWCKKSKFQKISWIIWDEWWLVQIFSYYFLVILFVSRDSIHLILKENKFHFFILTTFTRGVFRTQRLSIVGCFWENS